MHKSFLTNLFILIMSASSLMGQSYFQSQQVPSTVRSSKTAVLISSSGDKWQQIAAEIHPYFREAGIDAVAYYDFESVVVSEQTRNSYSEAFKQRQLDNIAIVTVTESPKGAYLQLGTFTYNNTILNPQSGLTLSSSNVEELGALLRNTLDNTSIAKENHLILEVPEFFSAETKVQANAIYKNYPSNLPSFKLSVERTAEVNAANVSLASLSYRLMGKDAQAISADLERESSYLSNIMDRYPYNFAYVPAGLTYANLRAQGFQFALVKVEGKESDLMKLFNIPAAQRKTKDDALVTKYYVYSLNQNEIFIGPVWDVSEQWYEALENFLKPLLRQPAPVEE